MVKIGTLLLKIIAAVAIVGCTTVGNERIADATLESVSASLIKGKTSQADVRKQYGDPITTSFTENGKEMWTYEFTRLEPKATNFIPYVNLLHQGAEGDKKSLVVMFDKNKVVQDYTISSSKIDISQGLLTR